MLPTDVLKSEHRVIEQVLNVLQKIGEKAGSEGKLDTESADQVIDFLRNFADRCHHGKEEHQLFPMLEERGFDRETGPTGVMCREHENGRDLIRGMSEAVADAGKPCGTAAERFAAYARAYVDMLRMHIEKEDHCLFGMADRTLSASDQESLMEQFEKVEAVDMGEGTHEKYLQLANALADRYGVPKASDATGDGTFVCSHHHAH